MGRAAVLLSGGGARGALQMAAIEHLARQGNVARWCGTSIGAINGLAASCQRISDLWRIWRGIDSTRHFQKLNLPDIANGMYTLKPLRKLIERERMLDVRQDFHVGTFDYGSARHKMVHVNPLTPDERLDAVLCSAEIPFIHEAGELLGMAVGDGGVAQVLPGCPGWKDFDEIHAVFCQPRLRLPRVPQASVRNGFQRAGRALDYMTHRVVVADHSRLRTWKRQRPDIRIFVYQPQDWDVVGKTFDADAETIQRRLDHGQWMVENRTEILLPGQKAAPVEPEPTRRRKPKLTGRPAPRPPARRRRA